MSAGAIIAGVVAVVLFSIVILMRSPWIGLLGWIAALSIQYEAFPDFRLALSDLFLPALTLTLLFGQIAGGGKKLEKRSSLSALILVFGAIFVTLGNVMAFLNLGTIPRWTWLNKDVGLLDLTLCFFAILKLVDTREKLCTVVRVLVLSASALNVLALAGGVARYLLGIPNMMMYSGADMRLAGFMVNPSAYGGFLICVLLIQLAILFGDDPVLPIPRRLQYINAGLLGMACLMTISRSAILGLLAGFVVLMRFYRLKAAIGLLCFVLVAGLTIGAVLHWGNFAGDMAEDFGILAFNETTVDIRMDVNQAAMDLLSKEPTNALIGVGVGTFLVRSEELVGDQFIIHNEFIWLLVETGILGLGLFVGIAWKSLRNCVRVWRARTSDSPIAAGLACSIFGTLVWMMGTEGLWHRHVWLLFGLSEVCYRLHGTDANPDLIRHRATPSGTAAALRESPL